MAEKTPGQVRSTERLMNYWAAGKGRAKINWGVPGDFDRCVVELGKYVGPGIVKGLCANLHKRATGGWPGHAPGAEQAMAKARKKGG
jgi:hypothetical protein